MRWPYDELKKKARYLYTGYTGILVQAMMICAAAYLAASYISMSAAGSTVIFLLISAITELFCQMLTAGRYGMMLDCGRSGQIKVSDVFVCFQRQPDKLLIVNIIIGVIRLLIFYLADSILRLLAMAPVSDVFYVIITILVYGAALAAYFCVSMSFALVYYLFFDHPKWSSMELLRCSREMMYGYKWQLFKIKFSFIGWFALGILSFGIGLLWIIPYMDLTVTRFYEETFCNEKR